MKRKDKTPRGMEQAEKITDVAIKDKNSILVVVCVSDMCVTEGR